MYTFCRGLASAPQDYLRYIQYEEELEELRAARARSRAISGKKGLAEFCIVRRTHFIYERATRKFRRGCGSRPRRARTCGRAATQPAAGAHDPAGMRAAGSAARLRLAGGRSPEAAAEVAPPNRCWLHLAGRRGDLDLWGRWLRFCQRTRSSKQMSKVLTKALQLHSGCAALWTYAAAWEFESNLNAAAARALMQRGLRMCKHAPQVRQVEQGVVAAGAGGSAAA